MSLRKISKNQGSFPSDEALLKLFYLELQSISQNEPCQSGIEKVHGTGLLFSLLLGCQSGKQLFVSTKFRTPPSKPKNGIIKRSQ